MTTTNNNTRVIAYIITTATGFSIKTPNPSGKAQVSIAIEYPAQVKGDRSHLDIVKEIAAEYFPNNRSQRALRKYTTRETSCDQFSGWGFNTDNAETVVDQYKVVEYCATR